MRELFPGWTPPDEETLQSYWAEATFALDTSVLLDLYRFSEDTRGELLKALRSFDERLWIPHQVALEFHRNRFGVLLDQREAEGALLDELDQLRRELDDQLSKRLRGAGRRDLAPLREAIDGGFDQLREQLKEAEKAHTKGLGESIREDPIYDEVVALFGERVGAEPSEERQAEILADARQRLEGKRPPGYMDADKDGDARFGDVILWHQLCEKAAESGGPVVLIADDQKEDWVWEVRGKTLGPRPELVAEMQEKAEVGFHIYTPARFLQVWKERAEGTQVEQEVLDEIEAQVRLPTWTLDREQRWWPAPEESEARMFRWPSPEFEAIAKHRLAGDGGSVTLTLTLHRAAKHESEIGVRVTVHRPDGSVASTEFPPSERGGIWEVQLRYPDHFPDEDPPAAGTYAVQWIVTTRYRSGELLHSEQLVAEDAFVLGPGASAER